MEVEVGISTLITENKNHIDTFCVWSYCIIMYKLYNFVIANQSIV